MSLAKGTRALYRGDFDRALSLAEAYLKSHPQLHAARILLARAQISNGQYDSALKGLVRLVQAEPKNIDVLDYLDPISHILSQYELQRPLADCSEVVRWTSVSGEPGWSGPPPTATPQNGLNEPHYHLKETKALCA